MLYSELAGFNRVRNSHRSLRAMRRFTRLTNAFSKKLENHMHAVNTSKPRGLRLDNPPATHL